MERPSGPRESAAKRGEQAEKKNGTKRRHGVRFDQQGAKRKKKKRTPGRCSLFSRLVSVTSSKWRNITHSLANIPSFCRFVRRSLWLLIRSGSSERFLSWRWDGCHLGRGKHRVLFQQLQHHSFFFGQGFIYDAIYDVIYDIPFEDEGKTLLDHFVIGWDVILFALFIYPLKSAAVGLKCFLVSIQAGERNLKIKNWTVGTLSLGRKRATITTQANCAYFRTTKIE